MVTGTGASTRSGREIWWLLVSDEEFAEFVSAALPRLLRFGLVLTGNPATAEDLVQTALARSWRAWRLHSIEDPQAFVRKVMVNSYASWYRLMATREALAASVAQTTVIDDEATRVDDRDAVWRALLTLPPKQRTVIVLRYYEELSESEIAAVMGTTTGTVKSQAARALRRLADVMTNADLAEARNHGRAAK